MKTSIRTILAVVAIGVTAVVAQAQTAIGQAATPRVVTVDLGKALNAYFRTAEESAKLQAFEQSANRTAEAIVTEGRSMAERFQAEQAVFSSPVSTPIAKEQAQTNAQRIYADIQNKERELNDFRQKAVAQIQQSVQQVRQQLLVEIANKATDLGKAKGANMILERNAFVFADAGMDITDEVIADLNKGQPVTPIIGL
jgi:Skp family chaperone for outer membrane proteins